MQDFQGSLALHVSCVVVPVRETVDQDVALGRHSWSLAKNLNPKPPKP